VRCPLRNLANKINKPYYLSIIFIFFAILRKIIMLIEFSISNFRSFDQRQSLSMVASPATEHVQTHAQDAGVRNVAPLLLSAAIYGANGAGKSNLLRGFWTLRNMVFNSAREGMRGDELPYEPFGLNKQSPTEFEVVFIADGKRWQYGLKYDNKRVVEEYLLAYKTQKPTRVFERSYDLATDGYHWNFHKSIDLERSRALLRPNALALSVLGGQFNTPELIAAFDWFRLSRVLNTHAPKLRRPAVVNGDALTKVFPYIQAIDPTLMHSRVREMTREFQLDDELPTIQTTYRIEFCHQTPNGDQMWLDLDIESVGTQQLYRLMEQLLSAMERGSITFVDELDNSLHPLLARSVVALFHDKKRNTAGAQLVFATHDATMLDLDLLREDQIWFVEKKPNLSTELYSLADIKGRHGAIEKGYLQGKFGAIPLLGSPLANG